MWMQEPVTYLPHSVRRCKLSLHGFFFPFNSSGFNFLTLLVWINSFKLFGAFCEKLGSEGLMLKLDLGVPGKRGRYKGRETPFWASSPFQDTARAEVVSGSGQDKYGGLETTKKPSKPLAHSQKDSRSSADTNSLTWGWKTSSRVLKIFPENLSDAHRALNSLAAGLMLPQDWRSPHLPVSSPFHTLLPSFRVFFFFLLQVENRGKTCQILCLVCYLVVKLCQLFWFFWTPFGFLLPFLFTHRYLQILGAATALNIQHIPAHSVAKEQEG